MKSFLTFLFLAATLIGSATAQPGQRRGGNGIYQDLPADVQDKIATLRGSFQAERTALDVQVRNGTLNRAEAQTKQTELLARHRAEVMALLTPEQRAEMEARQDRAMRQRNASRQAFMTTYFERMAADMKLNATKKTALKTLLDEHMAEMAPMQGQGRMRDFSERDEARNEMDQKVRALLSRDEYQIFRTYMDEHQRNSGPDKRQGQRQGQGRRGN